MRPERQQYYRYTDGEEPDGAVIIDTDQGQYRITEKVNGDWQKPFWIPDSEFEQLESELVGSLSSDQYMRVCMAADPELTA